MDSGLEAFSRNPTHGSLQTKKQRLPEPIPTAFR
jgi:hypothetical protein